MPARSSSTGVYNPSRVGLILKFSIFATGCAGIVAEFVLSTLATYLTGNAVFQWTMVMSLMLFAMGVGSRLTKNIQTRLLDNFILIEFTLSLLCASSATAAYGLSAHTNHISLLIYSMAIVIGGLIGFEIPLVTRLNDSYEELRSNIANVMEKDYYGSLFGGLFFAFFALPHLGLTYTPIVLGAINFTVAAILLWSFFPLLVMKRLVAGAFVLSCLCLAALVILARPIIMYGEQSQYRDKVVFSRQTRYQKIVITQYKDYYWLYINGQQQFSTFDEEKYHEPLVHPAMSISSDPGRVLILGGGDGLALREIWKHPRVRAVTMVDLDRAMTDLARENPVLVDVNQDSMRDPRLTVVNMDAAAYLRQDQSRYGVIIVDLPDPDSVDLMHLYSKGFYRLALRHLLPGGVMVTQAASPYFARKAFLCINKTMQASGLATVAYHNQVPTMGQWGWVLGARREEAAARPLKQRLLEANLDGLDTRFLNNSAMISMLHFGRDVFPEGWRDEVQANTQANPVLQEYYRQGTWAMY